MSRTRFLAAATAVLLLAAAMRLFMLHDIPPGLAQDEVLNADVASFIRGGAHALFFREGYGHEPLYHYWQVPFQVLLGDNVLSIRLPAVVIGLLLIALSMRWIKREFGGISAVITGIFLAVSWWPIVFSRIGLRPISEPLMLLLFAWFWPKRPWLAGLFLGLSLYTYTGARVVFAIPAVLFVYALITRKPRNPLRNVLARQNLIALAMALLMFVPLWLTLRADPTLQQRVDQLDVMVEALSAGNPTPLLDTTLATLGVFSFTGDPRWTYALPHNPLFDPISAVFFYAGLALAIWRWRQPRYALVLVWLAVGLLPSAITPDAPSLGRMIGALPVVYLMPALSLTAIWQWAQRRREQTRWLPAVVGVLLVVLLAWNGVRTVRDGFVTWANSAETREKYQSVLLDMARYWDANPHQPLVMATGFYRPITVDSLRRDLGRALPARWVQTGDDVVGAIVYPAESDALLYVPEQVSPRGWLWDSAEIDAQMPIYRSDAPTTFAVYPLGDAPTLEVASDTLFGGQIRLGGYEILPRESGQPLQLVTLWELEGALPEDLSIFVHLVAPDGSIVAQHDGFDAAPSTLQTGDKVLQAHELDLASAEIDDAILQLGLYQRSTGQRLLIDAPLPETPNDRLIIGGFER